MIIKNKLQIIYCYNIRLVLIKTCCVFAILILLSQNVIAGNAAYIALSNQIARKEQLEVVANNIANVNTIGYESDNVLFRNVEVKQQSRYSNSFVKTNGTYKSFEQGTLRMTNNITDLAIVGDGYFKILTPRGERYTLNGSVIINNANVLVNHQGYPFANLNSDPITLPDNLQNIYISKDGVIFINNEEIDTIGVFSIESKNQLIKEGNSLYISQIPAIISNNFTVVSGALRVSNVNSVEAMQDMLELQTSAKVTNSIMSDIVDLEKAAISKIVE